MGRIGRLAAGGAGLLAAAAALAGAARAAAPLAEPYGTLPDGRAVTRYTLRNAHGMTVRLLSLGGIITEIAVPDRAGRLANVVLTKPDLAAYARGANFSSLLGRYANRIAGGGFTLDGRRYELAGAGANGMVLHGGPNGFSEQVWAGTPFGGARGTSGVTLRHVSPDGTNGFPGTLDVSVRYSLGDDDTLRLDYRATTDRPTVLNLSHHVYFNLNGGAGLADDQCLAIDADRYAVLREQVATGEIPPVAGTPYDLRRPTRLGDRVAAGVLPRGYDTPFIVRRSGAGLVPAAEARDPGSGRTMTIRTTETTAHLFTPPAIPGAPRPPAGTPPHVVGYAIETQHLPQSPNHPEFPSTALRPGQVFRSTTTWHFGRRGAATGCEGGGGGARAATG